MIFWPCLEAIMGGQPPTTYFLPSECSFPEWNCWARDLGSVGERLQAVTPCSCTLASSGAFWVVPIRPAQCRPSPQQFASAGGWDVKAWAIQLNSSRVQYKACAHFCVPSVCITKCIGFRQVATQMISTRQIRPQPRTQSYPCKEYLPGTQFDDWVCISSVPLLVWWLLWDDTSRRTWCFQHHLLAATSRTFLCGTDFFWSRTAYAVQYSVTNYSIGKQAWWLDDFSMPQVNFDVMIDGESFADGESQATGSSGNSCTSQAPPQAEGGTTIEPTVTAGTSRSGNLDYVKEDGQINITAGLLWYIRHALYG